MQALSSIDRPQTLERLQLTHFDLIVIGGGITGAGIALDAASRGMRVALLEKKDFASGTSSKSTKLIHGGLRYLKQLEVALVREVGRERAIVHTLAPHLVRAEKMLLPLIEQGTYGPAATSVGLWVYDLLAGVKGTDKRKMLNKKQTLQKEPLLQPKSSILKGSGYYAEYRTDDARLTIENIKTATSKGALCANYVQVDDFKYNDGQVVGVKCTDLNTNDHFEIDASYIISAAGPWVDQLRKQDQSLKGKHLFLTKGVHIVVARERFPLKQSIYFDVPDGRMVFAIPRHRTTYIGTTDTPYEGSLDHIPILKEDVHYLLDAANQMFPNIKLKEEDIESSWAGLRPLIHEAGKSASEMSRKDEIFESSSGLISIAGGKLTGYRKMAERVVDLVSTQFRQKEGKSFRPCDTRNIALAKGRFKNAADVAAFEAEVSKKLATHQLPPYYTEYLVANYGPDTNAILSKLSGFEDEPEIALARAETWYTIHHELALHPLDFLNRRSGRLYFNLPGIPDVLAAVIADFATYFHWDNVKTQAIKQEVEKAMFEAAHFEKEAVDEINS
jgi:glycerol-3-phosphate dehydrogenase